VILTPGIFVRTTTFVLGSEKHAGKTTLLNYLVRRLRGPQPLAYLSVGVDGESRDLISGVPKPHVIATEGDWLVTAEQALRRSDSSAEIHEVFPFGTVMGPPVLARVVRGGPVELIGPGSNTQLAQVLEFLVADAGIETILVDGAINRVTQVASSTRGAYLFVLRVTRSNLARSIDAMRRLSCLQDVPVAPTDVAIDEATSIVDGALTAERADAIDTSFRTVIVEDFSRVFLTHAELASLRRRARLMFRRRLDFHGFVVNLHDLSRQQLLDMLADPVLEESIVFNPYQEVA